jgi:hypothetical protein
VKKEIGVIVFWGALWGLFEATVGYVLHILPINIGRLVWFPAAYFFMTKVYKETGRTESVLYTSVIAACIKLIDFLLPVRIDMVLNPFASIILEGIAVWALYRLLEEHGESLLKHDYVKALAMSMSWRLLYLVYLLPLPDFIVDISPLRGVIPLVKFLLMDGLTNSIVVYACILCVRRYNEIKDGNRREMPAAHEGWLLKSFGRFQLSPGLSFSVFLFAVFMEWVMKSLW